MGTKKRPKDDWAIGVNNTAFVVIDMQRAFVDDGAPYLCPGAKDIVPGINELAAMCRKARIPVIWVKANRRADLSDSDLMQDLAPKPEDEEMEPLAGKRGAEFCDGLDVKTGDYIVPKVRYSALISGSSSLEPLLRGLHRDRFIICGVATDVCVGATAMDAMCLGFKVFFIGDLTRTRHGERQKAALEVQDIHFSKVMTFDEVMKEIARLVR